MKAASEQLQTELAARGLELGDAVSVSHIIEAASDSVWKVISQPGQISPVLSGDHGYQMARCWGKRHGHVLQWRSLRARFCDVDRGSGI